MLKFKKLVPVSRVRHVVVLSALVMTMQCVSADEIDNALKIERITSRESRSKRRPAAARKTKTPAVVRTSRKKGFESISAKAAGNEEIPPVVRALQKKEMALIGARKEIAWLKDAVRKLWKKSKREESTLLYNLGCVYKAAGNYRKAEAEFLKAIEIDPSDAGAHYNLGILYDDDLKQAAKAREYYKRFLELSPDDRDAPRVHEWLVSLL